MKKLETKYKSFYTPLKELRSSRIFEKASLALKAVVI